MSAFLLILLVLVLVAVNGFFVAAEFAIVRSRRSRIEGHAEQGSRAARLPCSACPSILLRRERTIANSAATKKPLTATRTSTSKMSRKALIGYVARYFGGGRLRPFGALEYSFPARGHACGGPRVPY